MKKNGEVGMDGCHGGMRNGMTGRMAHGWDGDRVECGARCRR